VYADFDNAFSTLEPQMVRANGVDSLNVILGTKHADAEALSAFMVENKTDCALKVFETKAPVKFPKYILDAVA
jgi:putative ATP-dependent endonuclease of OLD family